MLTFSLALVIPPALSIEAQRRIKQARRKARQRALDRVLGRRADGSTIRPIQVGR